MAAIELYSTTLFSDANLVAYYRMETNSNDSKGSYNGTDSNMVYDTTAGKFNYYAYFNGTNAKIDLGNNAAMNPQAITVCGWIKLEANADVQTFYAHSDASAYYVTFNFSTQRKCRSYCTTYNGSHILGVGRDGTGAGQTAIPLDTWTHVAFTYDSTSGYAAYVNGVLDDSSAAAGTLDAQDANHSYLGWEEVNNRWWEAGYMDDVAIFNRALTSTEVNKLALGLWTIPKGSLLSMFR